MDDSYPYKLQKQSDFAYQLSQQQNYPKHYQNDDELSYLLALKLQNEEMYPPVPKEDEMSLKLALQLQKEEEEREARYFTRICEEEDRKQREKEEKLSLEFALRIQKLEKEKIENEKMDEKLAKEYHREYEEELSLRMAMKLNEETSTALIDEIIAQELQAEEYKNYGPGYWTEPQGTYPYRRIRLPTTSKLYTFVQEKFTTSNCAISYIEYVQNEKVWNSYQANKKKNPSIPEVYRFHGTPHTNVDGISQNGFLTSKDVSGRGTTIWSAESPMVSVGYARKGPAPDGTHFMFLAKVLSGMNNISTVNDGSTMYPEFLIAFKLK